MADKIKKKSTIVSKNGKSSTAKSEVKGNLAVASEAKKTMEEIHPELYQLAENVKSLLQMKEWSTGELVRSMGISETTLWRRLQKPYEFTLREEAILCEYFGLSHDQLRKPPYGRKNIYEVLREG